MCAERRERLGARISRAGLRLSHRLTRYAPRETPARPIHLTMSAFADTREMSPIVDIDMMYAYADIMIVRTARDLGAAIRDARLGHGWTQAELADRIDVSRQWVIALARGKASAALGPALRAVAALGMVANLVDAPTRDTGIDLDRLLGAEP